MSVCGCGCDLSPAIALYCSSCSLDHFRGYFSLQIFWYKFNRNEICYITQNQETPKTLWKKQIMDQAEKYSAKEIDLTIPP